MTNIIDWLFDTWNRFANGEVDHVVIGACRSDRDLAEEIRAIMYEGGHDCRIVYAESIGIDGNYSALTPGRIAITSIYTGGFLRGPHHHTLISRPAA